MRKYLFFLLVLISSVAHATLVYPGQTTDVSFEPTTGEHSPTWTTDNPTLHLSSVGFLCHVTAQAYFGGTATVTCTYKDRIGTSTTTRTRRWTFTCADTKITISPTTKNLKIGESFQLTWGFSNVTYINPNIQFTGYDNAVVSVSSGGQVTAKSEGSTQIYVKSNLGTNSAICTINVRKESSSTDALSPYDNWDSSNTLKLTLDEAGTLGDYITDANKYTIKNLTIIGPLNGSDLRLLRDMCGEDVNNKSTNGKLTVLDLKDAVFVSGGPWYVKAWQNYEYTEDSPIMPHCSFAWLRNLKKIRFPKYCTELTNRSLLQCSSLEYIAIPPGVTKLDYSSLDGGYDDMPMSVLTLPSSFEKFDANVYNCANLTDVYCYAIDPPSVSATYNFSNSNTNFKNGTLYVPKGSAKLYWQAEGWRDFKNIKETLEVMNTLSITVGEHGGVRYKGTEIRQKYGVSYTGYQAFEVPSENEVSIEILPEEGYSVSEILVDEKPINLSSENYYALGKLSKHTKLSVNFEESSSVEEIFNDNLDSTITVYNLQGEILKQNISQDDMNSLMPGLYIVKERTKTYKKLIN